MNVREWKRIAEKEVCRFGDHLAFLKGVEDAGGPKTERYHRSRRWAETVRAVCAYLAVHDASYTTGQVLQCDGGFFIG